MGSSRARRREHERGIWVRLSRTRPVLGRLHFGFASRKRRSGPASFPSSNLWPPTTSQSAVIGFVFADPRTHEPREAIDASRSGGPIPSGRPEFEVMLAGEIRRMGGRGMGRLRPVGDWIAGRYEIYAVHPGGMGIVYVATDRLDASGPERHCHQDFAR